MDGQVLSWEKRENPSLSPNRHSADIRSSSSPFFPYQRLVCPAHVMQLTPKKMERTSATSGECFWKKFSLLSTKDTKSVFSWLRLHLENVWIAVPSGYQEQGRQRTSQGWLRIWRHSKGIARGSYDITESPNQPPELLSFHTFHFSDNKSPSLWKALGLSFLLLGAKKYSNGYI